MDKENKNQRIRDLAGKLAFQTFSRISAVHETKNYVLIII
jgi:hypothetical protein